MATPKLATGQPISSLDKKEMSSGKFVTASVVVCVLAVILTGAFVRSQWPGIKLNNKVIDKKSKASTQLAKNLEAIPNLLSRYSELNSQGQVKLILEALPVKPDFPAILGAMEVLASASGVKLNSVGNSGASAPAETAPSDNPAQTPQPTSFNISVDGNYTSIINLFKNLELSARPMRVTQAQLAGSTNALQVTLDVQTFYMGPYDTTPKFEVVK